MLCFVVISITGRCPELISNPDHIKYFSFKCWHFNVYLTFKKVVPGFYLFNSY